MSNRRIVVQWAARCVLVSSMVAMSALLGGCEAVLLGAAIAGNDAGDTDANEAWADSVMLEVDNAHLAGSLGAVHDFSGDAATTEAYDDGDYLSVTLWAESGPLAPGMSGAVMAAFYASGEARERLFTPGQTLTVGATDVELTGSGCSGETMDAAFENESTAEALELEVSESEQAGMVHLTFTIDYGGGQTVRGSLDLAASIY